MIQIKYPSYNLTYNKFILFVITNILHISDQTRSDSFIRNHKDPFIALAKDLNSMCEVFSPNLLTYKKFVKQDLGIHLKHRRSGI